MEGKKIGTYSLCGGVKLGTYKPKPDKEQGKKQGKGKKK